MGVSSLRTVIAFPALLALVCVAAEPPATLNEVEAELRRLQERHDAMQANLSTQQRLLDEILRRASELDATPPEAVTRRGEDSTFPVIPRPVASETDAPRLAPERAAGPATNTTRGPRLNGHAAFVARRAERAAALRGDTLRTDEVKLEVGGALAPRWRWWGELEVLTRERYRRGMQIAEAYVEFKPLAERSEVRIRLGRIEVPFGREYLRRDASHNPLISRSAADTRGVDEGIQLQGAAGSWDWAVALQNGLHRPASHLFAARSIAVRGGYSSARGYRLGLSALRTGRLPQEAGAEGPLWLGNAPMRRLPGSQAPSVRLSGLALDASVAGRAGRIAAEAGVLVYRDDDPRRAVRRGVPFLTVEAVGELGRGAYGAVRYSRVGAASGFFLPGDGRLEDVRLTEELERLSLGFGYRPAPPLLLKLEHTFQRGRWAGGAERAEENQTAAEAVVRF